MPKVLPLATAFESRNGRFAGLNEPALDEDPRLLYTLAYCELIDALADTFFPPTLIDNVSGPKQISASMARVDRYIHCRSAWDSAFGRSVQLALRDLSYSAKHYSDKPFIHMDPSLRNTLLDNLKKGAIPAADWGSARSQAETFAILHDAVASGLLADPGYGGNAQGLGWEYSQFTL